jgi:hypothetical protein
MEGPEPAAQGRKLFVLIEKADQAQGLKFAPNGLFKVKQAAGQLCHG